MQWTNLKSIKVRFKIISDKNNIQDINNKPNPLGYVSRSYWDKSICQGNFIILKTWANSAKWELVLDFMPPKYLEFIYTSLANKQKLFFYGDCFLYKYIGIFILHTDTHIHGRNMVWRRYCEGGWRDMFVWGWSWYKWGTVSWYKRGIFECLLEENDMKRERERECVCVCVCVCVHIRYEDV